MDPRIGDLIFVHSDTLVGDLIDWAENGEFSHVAIYVGADQIVEAQGFEKVQCKPLNTYAGHYVIGHVDANTVDRMYALNWWRKQLGKRYAWGLIWHLFLKLVLHVNRPATFSSAQFICSTLAWRGWKEGGGIALTDNEDVTPQDLANSPLVHLSRP